MPEDADGLLLAVIDLQDLRPLRPRIRRGTLDRRLRHHLDLGHRLRALANRGTAAVVSSITATDDDDVLPLRVDDAEGMLALLVEGLRLARQVVDGVVDAVRLLDERHVQPARLLRATGEDDRVVVPKDRCHGDCAALCRGQCLRRNVRHCAALFCSRRLLSGSGTCLPPVCIGSGRCGSQCLAADVHTGAEDDAFRFHEGATTTDDRLVELHVRDAVHEETADLIRALEDGDAVAAMIQLIRCGEAGRTGTDDCDTLPRADLRDPRLHVALLEGGLDDVKLIVVRRHRRVIEALDAGLLAERRADTTRELREVVRLQKTAQRVGDVAVVDLIVPLRAEIVERAAREHTRQLHAGLAERNAAVHAARALLPTLLLREGDVKFLEIFDTLLYRNVFIFFSRIIEKSCYLTHEYSPIF